MAEKKAVDMETNDTRSDLRDVGDYHIDNLQTRKESCQLDQISLCIYDKSDRDQSKGGK